MSKKNNLFTIVGKTSDGKDLVEGIWKVYETYGLPLDSIFDVCIRKNWMPDWITLYIQMVTSGMEHGRILSKLEEALNDSFGKEFGTVVISTLDKIYRHD